MDELGFTTTGAVPWFTSEKETPYVLIRVKAEYAAEWPQVLRDVFRRCYVTDEVLQERAEVLAKELGRDVQVLKAELLSSKLPDPGSTMAGDFGEILTYVYQAAAAHPLVAFGPKKWRLKQDRTKPAPFSDVVHFILPSWPVPSGDDTVLCAEVKTKSTKNASTPLSDAIADCAKDRNSRLAKTLVWLRERAMGESLGAVTIEQLNRFINATEYPQATKRFRAVAIICASLVKNELVNAPVRLLRTVFWL
jgi:Cap4 SAVED domain